MSSFVFKIIAIISMLIDHIGACLGGLNILRYIGRISFPIFAWQISVGAEKTKNIKKYLFRLLIFAIVSQPTYMLFMNDLIGIQNISLNIGFTLLLGLVCIILLKENKIIGIPFTIIIAYLSELLKIEYGWYGILMITLFYIFKDNKFLLFIAQMINFLAYYFITDIWQQGISLLSILMILLFYNGKKGRSDKLFFYLFYPLHFLILYISIKYM